MPSRLYSFRYPYDIQATLEPWRDQLGEQYAAVLAHLSDRDRAIEDHLSLGMAQGYLGTGLASGAPITLTGSYADMAGMSVAFSAPAPRRLKITAYASVSNLDAVQRSSGIRVLDESSNVLVLDSWAHAALGGVGASYRYNTIQFVQAAAGAHTYKLQAFINGANGTLTSASTSESFLSVEDVGPA